MLIRGRCFQRLSVNSTFENPERIGIPSVIGRRGFPTSENGVGDKEAVERIVMMLRQLAQKINAFVFDGGFLEPGVTNCAGQIVFRAAGQWEFSQRVLDLDFPKAGLMENPAEIVLTGGVPNVFGQTRTIRENPQGDLRIQKDRSHFDGRDLIWELS